jgi:molybdate-binding protein/DNA-binding XRE family transcriptional regulator
MVSSKHGDANADDYQAPTARVHSRLAEARQSRGIAAAALARLAGVTRQTIYAIEAGTYVPNTAIALKLARALETPVEDLFQLDAEPPAPRLVAARLIGGTECCQGTLVQLCKVGEKLVGVPAVAAPWQLPPADAVLADPARGLVQRLADDDHEARLLIAGCDPAVSVLARHLQRASVQLVAAAVNSSVALDLLRERLVHVAGTHLRADPRSATVPFRGAAVFVFAVWEEGIVTARGNPKHLRNAADLARRGVRLVNRESGSGARQLLDRALAAAGLEFGCIAGYDDPPAAGHLSAAWRVYSGLADCCIATRSAARAFGLDFVPLESNRYDLVLRTEHLQITAVERLFDTLAQTAVRRELETLCGYDTRETGRRLL